MGRRPTIVAGLVVTALIVGLAGMYLRKQNQRKTESYSEVEIATLALNAGGAVVVNTNVFRVRAAPVAFVVGVASVWLWADRTLKFAS